MKVHLLFPTKWKSLDKRVADLQAYLSTRYKSIYGSVTISYDIVGLPDLTLNSQGVYNKSDILKITKPYHTSYDAVGIIFPRVKTEKYFGNYYANDGTEYKMDFYVKSDERNRDINEQMEDMVEHEMAHAVALDLGLSQQNTSTGYVAGADNTHYYFYNNKKDEFYKEVQEQWKKKFSLLSQMLLASSKLLEQLIGKKKIDKPTDLLPEVKEKMERLIKICELMDMPIRVTSGFRSFEEQNRLYAQGRTTAGKIVTNAKGGESDHNFGKAFDIVFRKTGYEGNWELVGQIGEAIGLKWGGRWKSFVDRPHFYI